MAIAREIFTIDQFAAGLNGFADFDPAIQVVQLADKLATNPGLADSGIRPGNKKSFGHAIMPRQRVTHMNAERLCDAEVWNLGGSTGIFSLGLPMKNPWA